MIVLLGVSKAVVRTGPHGHFLDEAQSSLVFCDPDPMLGVRWRLSRRQMLQKGRRMLQSRD